MLAPFSRTSTPLRPFGRAEDLGLDFADDDRPALVTALLASCDAAGREDAASDWWRQPVGTRTAALLHLLDSSEPAQPIEMQSRCNQSGCGERFEFVLPLASLQGEAPGSDRVTVPLDGERSASLRLPTGDDLRRWRAARPASRDAAVAAMLADLRLEGDVRRDDETRVSDAIALHDPLVAFSVACECPVCGAAQQVGVDLEGLALNRLAMRQRDLVRQVHRLASHYGWTEAQVLAVAPARRAAYLALIDADEA